MIKKRIKRKVLEYAKEYCLKEGIDLIIHKNKYSLNNHFYEMSRFYFYFMSSKSILGAYTYNRHLISIYLANYKVPMHPAIHIYKKVNPMTITHEIGHYIIDKNNKKQTELNAEFHSIELLDKILTEREFCKIRRKHKRRTMRIFEIMLNRKLYMYEDDFMFYF